MEAVLPTWMATVTDLRRLPRFQRKYMDSCPTVPQVSNATGWNNNIQAGIIIIMKIIFIIIIVSNKIKSEVTLLSLLLYNILSYINKLSP